MVSRSPAVLFEIENHEFPSNLNSILKENWASNFKHESELLVSIPSGTRPMPQPGMLGCILSLAGKQAAYTYNAIGCEHIDIGHSSR